MLKKILLALGIFMSASIYAIPVLNIYTFEVKKDKETSYKTIIEDYVNKTVNAEQGVLGLFATTEERDKTTSFIFEIYNDYLAFSSHTKGQANNDFKAIIPQIAEGNLSNIEIDLQIAKDKKIEQSENTFVVCTVINVKTENNKEFSEIIKNIVNVTFDKNASILAYLGTDRKNPNKWYLFEIFNDVDAYLNHRSANYFKAYITETKDMIVEQKRFELQPLKLINKGGLDFKKLY